MAQEMALSAELCREAEGGGLLNRYTVEKCIEGSNPSGSATQSFDFT